MAERKKICQICGHLYINSCSSCAKKGNKNPMFDKGYLINTKGKKNGRYIDGKYCKKYYCIDCKKEVSKYTCKRCQSCAVKHLFKIGKLNTKNKNNGMFNKIGPNKGKTGKLSPNYIDGRSLKINNCIICNKKISWRAKRCSSCSASQQHKDNIFNYHRKINKPELLLKKLLNKILSKEYKFVGNNKMTIDVFNPDFINTNGQKKIIELYGDYWHNRKEAKERDIRRIKSYKKHGYKTLIIWEHELKEPEQVIAKIMEFDIRRKV